MPVVTEERFDPSAGSCSPGGDADVSLYIHVPFCTSKCDYCDFVSLSVERASPAAEELFERFFEAVARDVHILTAAGLLDRVPTIYVGGGTPTVLGPVLVRLVEAVASLPGVLSGSEVTCEANPESLDRALAGALAAAGATRISLGVQSLEDDVLRWLGRRHDAEQALAAAEAVRAAGLALSLDLMCGVPGLSVRSWMRTLHRAIETGCGHVSVYPLTVEPKTRLASRLDEGAVEAPAADVAAEQMVRAEEVLASAGYARYEVANYALPGQECLHNMRYWTAGAYVGIGPGAASMLPVTCARRIPGFAESVQLLARAARVRSVNGSDVHGFLETPWGQGAAEVEWLTHEQALREDAMLGMRLASGITARLAEEAGVTPVLEELEDLGLVERRNGRWSTTERGWLLGNEVYSRLWLAE